MEWVWLLIGFVIGRFGKFILTLTLILITIGFISSVLNPT